MENEEQKPAEEVIQEAVEQVKEEQVVDDRPERNWKAELDRKNRLLEQREAELNALRQNSVQRRDANDISTWSDHELKAVVNSNDPTVLPYKAQADEILFERRVRSIREREKAQEKRALADMELRSKYPEALDPASELAVKMEEIMYQFDLEKSPAGRLLAAKHAALELSKGATKAKAAGRQEEESRVRDVKAQLTDGDRPAPSAEHTNPRKEEDLKHAMMRGNSDAVGEFLKKRGISADNFFKK